MLKRVIKSPYIWVIIIILIPGIIALVLLNFREENNGFLLISNIDTFFCDKKKCKEIPPEDLLKKEQNGYQVYQENNYLGTFKLSYLNRWNFFDENGNWLNLSSDFIVGSKDLNLIVKPFEIRKMNTKEQEILDKELKKHNIMAYSSLKQNEVLEYDFNHNGKKETIILASNASDDNKDEKLFAMVVGIVNSKVKVYHIDIFNKFENLKVPTYRIKSIINMFKSKEDVLVLIKGYFSEAGETTSYIYKAEKKNFKLINEV